MSFWSDEYKIVEGGCIEKVHSKICDTKLFKIIRSRIMLIISGQLFDQTELIYLFKSKYLISDSRLNI